MMPNTQPVLFIGHGNPMNAIEDNTYRRSWQALGTQFGALYPRPNAILCISAHWLTTGWQLTAMRQPPTIHDFGGFPQALFDERYAAPGSPALAQTWALQLRQPESGLPLVLNQDWGLDHGAWSVLKPMFPAADIPVLQLSMDDSRPPATHFALGRQLRGLREQGVLIVASGNLVHNLRLWRQSTGAAPYPWAVAFDAWAARCIESGNLSALADFQAQGETAAQAHPTHEHYLPLLYAAGAAQQGEPVRFFNTSFQAPSISMRSVVWG